MADISKRCECKYINLVVYFDMVYYFNKQPETMEKFVFVQYCTLCNIHKIDNTSHYYSSEPIFNVRYKDNHWVITNRNNETIEAINMDGNDYVLIKERLDKNYIHSFYIGTNEISAYVHSKGGASMLYFGTHISSEYLRTRLYIVPVTHIKPAKNK